jgi:hypothetical protein
MGVSPRRVAASKSGDESPYSKSSPWTFVVSNLVQEIPPLGPRENELLTPPPRIVKEHFVGIKPEGGLSIFQLVYVETPASDNKK